MKRSPQLATQRWDSLATSRNVLSGHARSHDFVVSTKKLPLLAQNSSLTHRRKSPFSAYVYLS